MNNNRGVHTVSLYRQRKDILYKEILLVYHTDNVDAVFYNLCSHKRYDNRRFGRTDTVDDQHLGDLLPWHVCPCWIDSVRYTDFQKIHTIQGDQATRNGDQLLNRTLNIPLGCLPLLYGASTSRSDHTDYVLWSRIYDPTHEGRHASVQIHYHGYR